PRSARRSHLRQLPAPLTVAARPGTARRHRWATLSRRLLLAALLALAPTVWPPAAAQTPAPSAAQAPIPDLPLTQVAAGMAGYGLTAGPSDTIERFPVEVVGVQYDAVPGLDLVLIRVSGPFIESSGGVAAGMSGSPVYLYVG